MTDQPIYGKVCHATGSGVDIKEKNTPRSKFPLSNFALKKIPNVRPLTFQAVTLVGKPRF